MCMIAACRVGMSMTSIDVTRLDYVMIQHTCTSLAKVLLQPLTILE